MGQAAIPLMLISTGASIVGQRKAASAEARDIENQAKRAAEQAKIQANEESIARKEKLLAALSATAAGAGASGAGLAGSTYNIMQTDIGEFEKEQQRADLGSSIAQAQSLQAGRTGARAARMRGNIGAATSLISLGSGLAAAGGTGVKPSSVTPGGGGGGGAPVGSLYS